jgi:hypothetical protein
MGLAQSRMQKIIQHEGCRTRHISHDGHERVFEPKRHEASTTFSRDEVVEADMETLVAKFDRAAEEMAASSTRHFLQRIEETAREVGNVYDMRGGRLTLDAMLKGLEMIEIDFDETGKPQLPSLVVNPAMVPRLKELQAESDQNPEYKRKWDEIIERKREAWRAREADRRLVG